MRLSSVARSWRLECEDLRTRIEKLEKKYKDEWEKKGVKGIKPMVDIDTIFEELLSGSEKDENRVGSVSKHPTEKEGSGKPVRPSEKPKGEKE